MEAMECMKPMDSMGSVGVCAFTQRLTHLTGFVSRGRTSDLFVLALLASSTFGLAWSYTQSNGQTGLGYLFFVLFVIANLILFGGVYWSKFAHMFYKPGAAVQKNLAEADGSRDNLPPPAEAPAQFGLGIKREEPKHY